MKIFKLIVLAGYMTTGFMGTAMAADTSSPAGSDLGDTAGVQAGAPNPDQGDNPSAERGQDVPLHWPRGAVTFGPVSESVPVDASGSGTSPSRARRPVRLPGPSYPPGPATAARLDRAIAAMRDVVKRGSAPGGAAGVQAGAPNPDQGDNPSAERGQDVPLHWPRGAVTFGPVSESVPVDASGTGNPPRSTKKRVRFADSAAPSSPPRSVAAERLDQAIAALSDAIESFVAVDQESLNLKRQLVLIYNRLVTIQQAMGSSDGARQ